MSRTIRALAAAVVGVLLVTASVFGAVMMQPTVDDLDDAATYAGFGTTEAASFWSIVEKMSVTAGGLSVTNLWDDSSVNKSELDSLDALETKKELHAQFGTQDQNNDNYQTSVENYLQDTETIATLEGKNAYIRALENGSSESEARTAARTAVSDYYSLKQKNLIASWNTTASVVRSSRIAANNTTDISESFIDMNTTEPGSVSPNYVDNGYLASEDFDSLGVQQHSLANGTTVDVAAIHQVAEYTSDMYGTTTFLNDSNGDTVYGDITGFYAKGPTTDFNPQTVGDTVRFKATWDDIESQNTQVQNELDTFVTATYDSYTMGQINETDLVDPYLGAREYGPDDGFQTWALMSATSLGIDAPENLSNVGKMVVTDHTASLEYEGIVLTDENPDGGLSVNTTYDASNLNGTQMVVTSSTTRELTGEFTLESATDSDGNEINKSVTYKTINYNTTNTSEYQDLMEQLDVLQAEINARQQQARSGGGGFFSGFDLGLGGIGAPAGLLVAGGVAVLLLGRN